MLLKVLAAGQSQLHSLRLSGGITLALCYVYERKKLDNESWICNHLCNGTDKSFPTHWNATLALMAIDKLAIKQWQCNDKHICGQFCHCVLQPSLL